MNGPDDRLPSHLMRLIEAERRHPGPSDEARARTFASIAATLGLPAGPGGPDGSDGSVGGEGAGPGDIPGGLDQAVSAAATKASLVGTLLKPVTIIAFAVGAATGAGTYAVLSTPTPTPTTPAPTVARVERPATPPEVAPPPRRYLLATPPDQGQWHDQGRDVAHTPRPRQPRSAAKRVALGRSAALAAERTLLEMARTALARGRAADALNALDQHRRRFTAGQLAEEREALSILALVKLGDADHARARAARFRARYPRSFFGPAVEDALKKAD
jgi:uncharacterized membrane protein